MTRDELRQEILECKSRHYMFQLATSVGKTKLCLDKISNTYPTSLPNILIVVPYKNLIQGWKDEFNKWGYNKYLARVTFTCYASLQKHIKAWHVVVLDEGHHTSERCQDLLKSFIIGHLFVLSATLSREHKWFFKSRFSGIKEFNVNIHNAIDEGILPEPRVILLPLNLDNTHTIDVVIKNPKAPLAKPVYINYKDRWTYSKYKGKITMRCTPVQYVEYLDSLIDWANRTGKKIIAAQKGGVRLKFLATQKHSTILSILKHLNKHRTLTFCGTIDNAQALGYPRVDSKIGNENLEKFNAKEIDHLSCVEILDEGANLIDCQIGIFQMINTSTRMSIQRSGRIYRHKEPILIFPYYKGTKEEQTVEEIISGYKEYLIKRISNINEIRI